jgi:hypothetical protein
MEKLIAVIEKQRQVWWFVAAIVLAMLVEVMGLGYTWASGRETIFHAPEYTLGSSINVHFWGHVIGGLTWEPVFIFLMMLIIRGVYVAATSVAKLRTQ